MPCYGHNRHDNGENVNSLPDYYNFFFGIKNPHFCADFLLDVDHHPPKPIVESTSIGLKMKNSPSPLKKEKLRRAEVEKMGVASLVPNNAHSCKLKILWLRQFLFYFSQKLEIPFAFSEIKKSTLRCGFSN